MLCVKVKCMMTNRFRIYCDFLELVVCLYKAVVLQLHLNYIMPFCWLKHLLQTVLCKGKLLV